MISPLSSSPASAGYPADFDTPAAARPRTGFMDYTDDALTSGPGLLAEEGIGYHPGVAGSGLASRDRLEAGAQGIIAILIGL